MFVTDASVVLVSRGTNVGAFDAYQYKLTAETAGAFADICTLCIPVGCWNLVASSRLVFDVGSRGSDNAARGHGVVFAMTSYEKDLRILSAAN
jgi:hypothetical protein